MAVQEAEHRQVSSRADGKDASWEGSGRRENASRSAQEGPRRVGPCAEGIRAVSGEGPRPHMGLGAADHTTSLPKGPCREDQVVARKAAVDLSPCLVGRSLQVACYGAVADRTGRDRVALSHAAQNPSPGALVQSSTAARHRSDPDQAGHDRSPLDRAHPGVRIHCPRVPVCPALLAWVAGRSEVPEAGCWVLEASEHPFLPVPSPAPLAPGEEVGRAVSTCVAYHIAAPLE